MYFPRALTLSLSLLGSLAFAALDVNFDDPESIKKAAKLVAKDLIAFYPGAEPGRTPGILDGPPPDGDYYWWEAGAMWGTLVEYWYYTGDDTYNEVTKDSLIFQSGNNDYMPPNWTASLGNDDQGFWGLSAMLAAELNFVNPDDDQPQWLGLAQGVFNTQASPDRHDKPDASNCGDGLRWQIPFSNNGYNYKNAIANGIFFNMGARLARFTRNGTYTEYVNDTYDWMVKYKLIDDKYNIYDGVRLSTNPPCGVDKAQYSYNAAVMTQGAAFMYNWTNGSDVWRERTDGLLNQTINFFFPDGTMYEPACELAKPFNCNTDMRSFKGYMLRWLATTAQIAPFTSDRIKKVLRTSAENAIKTCTGGDNGRMCGFQWTKNGFDGRTGVGEQMNALAALMVQLMDDKKAPYTSDNGGTSKGDPSGGYGTNLNDPFANSPITQGSKAAAGILTTLVLVGGSLTFAWMASNMNEMGTSVKALR